MPSVMAMSSLTVSVPASQSITVYTQAVAQVFQVISGAPSLIGTVSNSQQSYGPFAGGASILIATGQLPAMFTTGAAPVIPNLMSCRRAWHWPDNVKLSAWDKLLTSNRSGHRSHQRLSNGRRLRLVRDCCRPIWLHCHCIGWPYLHRECSC
jgi:hypothetical protein